MTNIKLPSTFKLKDLSFKITIETLISFIKPKNETIIVDFSELENTTKGDLMILMAQLEKSTLSNKNRIYRKGSLPKIKKVRNMLMTSMDLVHVNKDITVNKLEDSEKAQILNPSLIDSVVKDLRKIGIKDYFTPFNEFLIELIANAVEHGISNKNINWWLTHEIDWEKKEVKYTFVDMGLGIIGSHKKAGLPIKYKFLPDKYIVLDSLFAKLRSSTKETNRGRGLPQLRTMIEKGYVTDVMLISNNVSLQYENDKFVASKNMCFVGTYYSWVINKKCFDKWKN